MDPVTHAASGAVALLALSRRPATLWSLPLAAIACAAPDIDLIFIHTPLQFLQLHRGITHSLAGSIPLGFILALLCWPLWRKTTPERWSFAAVWLFCIAMIWLHIWLDIVTTYGTMIFLPFSHYRVRLNGLFIIDLLITLPLLWAVWRWRAKRGLILLAFAWIFLYPGLNVAANYWHKHQWHKELANQPELAAQVTILPDIFTPFFWRALYPEDTPNGKVIVDQPLNFLGQPRGQRLTLPAAPQPLMDKIMAASLAGETYFQFAMLPVMTDLRAEDAPSPELPDSEGFMFYDLRFGSGIKFVQEILNMRPNADVPFQLLAEFAPDKSAYPGENDNPLDMDLKRIRLRFTDSGRDSRWHTPQRPEKPGIWQWLVGLE